MVHQPVQKQFESTVTSTSGNKRLTRSTYVEDISSIPQSGGRRKRSDSNDSENGWIPPPPLLPLNTQFLLTRSRPDDTLDRSIDLHTDHEAIPSNLAVAHLKCARLTTSENPDILSSNTLSNPSPSFRLLDETDILNSIPPARRIISLSNSQTQATESLQAESSLFARLHRQSEALEKRSKKLEMERLVHARFKLKAHLDLLMTASGPDWKSVRTLSLRRIKEDQMIQRSKGQNLSDDGSNHETEWEKVERVRQVMIKETKETLKRYEKLLDTTRKVSKPRSNGPPASVTGKHIHAESPFKTTKISASPRKQAARANLNTPSRNRLRNPNPALKSLKLINPHASLGAPSIANLSNPPPLLLPPPPPSLSDLGYELSKQSDSQQGLVVKHTRNSSVAPSRIVSETSIRESLYSSPSIRRLALDEQITNGQRRVGRTIYALGCKLPDLSLIRLNHLSRLQSMSLEQTRPSISTPFDRPDRSTETSIGPNLRIGGDETGDDLEEWIEFNPTVNEEKQIIEHQSEFGTGSKFFELDDELDYLESREKDKPNGKSIRKLIQERLSKP